MIAIGYESSDRRAIDFGATDIYHIANGRVAENWYLEDLTLLHQLGAAVR